MNYNPYPFMYQQQQQPVQQIQSSGLVSVRGIEEAKGYPVAPGNSVTFKDETAPYIYTKTMGFSQLDRPSFEVFKLVKEDYEPAEQKAEFDIHDEIKRLRDDVEILKLKIEEAEADG